MLFCDPSGDSLRVCVAGSVGEVVLFKETFTELSVRLQTHNPLVPEVFFVLFR